MKVERRAERAVSDTTCKAATGRTLTEWHSAIDARGGLSLGRRELGNWLVGELGVDPWWSSTIAHEYELARGAVEKDGKPKGYTICATRTIKSDPGPLSRGVCVERRARRLVRTRARSPARGWRPLAQRRRQHGDRPQGEPRQVDPLAVAGPGAHDADAG